MLVLGNSRCLTTEDDGRDEDYDFVYKVGVEELLGEVAPATILNHGITRKRLPRSRQVRSAT